MQLADHLVIGDGEAELLGDALGLPLCRAEEGGLFEGDGPVGGGLRGLAGLRRSLAIGDHGVDPFECAGGR